MIICREYVLINKTVETTQQLLLAVLPLFYEVRICEKIPGFIFRGIAKIIEMFVAIIDMLMVFNKA